MLHGLLVYPISTDHAGSAGILQKMRHQAAAFRELGGAGTLVCNSTSGLVVDGEVKVRYRRRDGFFRKINHNAGFYTTLAGAVDPAAYDFAYFRYPGATPPFVWLLRNLKRHNPNLVIVVEIPTFPFRNESTRWQDRLRFLSDDALSPLLRRYVSRVVTFFGQPEIYGIPTYTTSNGIDVGDLPLRRTIATPEGGPVRFLGVATMAKWHGYDRVISGMARYPGRDRVRLFLAGDGPEIARYRQLVDRHGLGAQVDFLGSVTGGQLDELYERCDVALGSLGMHRLALASVSSLKTREFCSRGVPFILSGEDADFAGDLPFVHKVVSDESELDMDLAVAFALRMRSEQPAIGLAMRNYALANLTWSAKLMPLVEDIAKLRGEGRAI